MTETQQTILQWSVQKKADYVKSQVQERIHACHWPECDTQVPPAKWGCKWHWFQLPISIRNKIWAAYRPGQEKNMKVSRAYITAAREAQAWIRTTTSSNQPEDGD